MSLHASTRLGAIALFACALHVPLTASAATMVIVNNDGAGEGFNDGTAASPVGGNPATTIGAQRLYVFQYAANIWGNLLPSNIQIRVQAKFDPQTCSQTSGVLGSAGPMATFRDFPGAPVGGHWYHVALANKLSNSDLSGSDDIGITFNSGIGGGSCLPEGWYYGVDGNEGNAIELLPVVLHEMGHGLGFSTTTSGSSGTQSGGYPSIYDRFLYDNTVGLHWDQMTGPQRVNSATACTHLVWDGPWVTQNAPARLADKPLLRVNTPASIDGDYEVGLAAFGPVLGSPGVTQNVVLANDGVANPSNGCEAFVNAAAINGKIALVDRGTCGFVIKVKNAQNAGAIGVIVVDSIPGCPPGGMSGFDPTITIPAVRVTQADGNLIKASLAGGVNATMTRDPNFMAGADAQGHVFMYTPSTFAGGSSISHWDVSADPDLLMEPALNRGLFSDVDLARWHFADIGWFDPNLLGVEPGTQVASRLIGNRPNPFRASTAIEFALERDQEIELGVYDLSGRLVARLESGRASQGRHTVRWDGRDREGRSASPGIYVYRLRAGERVESRHMVLFK